MKLRQYLLGMTTEKQQNEIEERYFADNEYFENMLAAEDELVEAYVSGELTRRERKRFDECLLPNPKWQAKVANIRALKQVVNEHKITISPEKISLLDRIGDWWKDFTASIFEQKMVIGLGYATILLLLIFSSVWVGRKLQHYHQKIANLEAEQNELAQQGEQLRQQLEQQTGVATEFTQRLEQEQQQRSKLEQLLDKMKPQSTPMLAFALEPGLLRDSASPRRLVIPSNVQSVRFDLITETEIGYPIYLLVINTIEGDEVYSQMGIAAQKTARGHSLNLNLPTIAFATDDYILTLSGITAAGKTEILHRYFFSVVRR